MTFKRVIVEYCREGEQCRRDSYFVELLQECRLRVRHKVQANLKACNVKLAEFGASSMELALSIADTSANHRNRRLP